MGRNTLETRTLHTIGRAAVRGSREIDCDPDTSWRGTFGPYREPANVNEKLVHRASGLVLDHHGVWRDAHGRLAATPDANRYSREHDYTFHNNGHEKIAHALADSKRLEDINNGNISFYGIVASVELDGAEIGHASVWGVESDSGHEYLAQTEREEAHEALADAREWRARNLG